VRASARRLESGEARRRIQAELLGRLRLDKREVGAEITPELRRDVERALKAIVEDAEFDVQPEDQKRLVSELAAEALGLGPLDALLADEQVSEVMVVDPKTIYAERGGKLELTGRVFTDGEAVRSAIERIVTPLGRRIDESSPLVDARLPDGSRVNAVIPPLALRGPCITIRKFPRHRLELGALVDKGSLSPRMARFLERSVRLRKNIVVSGGTGSGKTTLLNVLSAAIDPHERIVTIEDAAELNLAQPHVVGLESKPPNLEGRGEYTIRDLVKNALRMRPDRIVVGECRGGEALDMLQAMNTGHEGSMTTTHANSTEGALARLETLCLMGGLDLPVSAIRRQIADSVHLVLQQTRLADGSRRVSQISEVCGLDDEGHVQLRCLFALERDGRGGWRHVATGFMPSYLSELDCEFGKDKHEVF
jgi:pilus assembly protein CpaF